MSSSFILGITGPTASGKSNISVLLAKKMNAEIISIDSVQIYKKFNIGTAKPTKTETNGIKHHLIDIVEPWQTYSSKNFLDDVKACICKIHACNKQVLLTGGTMFYFKVLIEGLSLLPSSCLTIRQRLQEISLRQLYQLLLKYDPETSKKISSNDRQRIQRVVEVSIINQKPYSVLVKSSPKKGGLGNQIILCALVPKKRQVLHKRITQRFYKILEKGFLAEVEELNKHSLITADLPAMRSVGYRQALQYFDGQFNYNNFISKSIVATRQLAKRQLTWIRNWPTQIKLFEYDQDSCFNIERLCQYFSMISHSSKYSSCFFPI